MTEATDLLAAGRLLEATKKLIGEVKENPGDASRRTFLFELSCFAGDWERAERQLDVIGHQSVQAELGVSIYRANLKAEKERARVFSEGIEPHFLSEPPAYVDLYLTAINCLRQGQAAQAHIALEQAEEDRPAITGKRDGIPFQDFRDYDDFVGGVLELIVKDEYVWLPFEQIKRLEIVPPKQLRDFMWASVRIEALDGTVGEVYVPSLYAGTSTHPDDQVRLGRITEWMKIGDDLLRSYGLRLFAVDGDEKSLFEVGVLEFNPQGDPPEPAVG